MFGGVSEVRGRTKQNDAGIEAKGTRHGEEDWDQMISTLIRHIATTQKLFFLFIAAQRQILE